MNDFVRTNGEGLSGTPQGPVQGAKCRKLNRQQGTPLVNP